MFIIPISGIGTAQLPEQAEAGLRQEQTSSSFKNLLEEAIQNAEIQQRKSEDTDQLLASGQIDDLHTALIQAEQTAAAVEFTTQLTSRAVSAYNQIMGMQV